MNDHQEPNTEEARPTGHETEGVVRLDDGRRLAFVDHGEPGAPVVVFCHGSGSSRDGLGLASLVAAAGGRLISPARPGIGASDAKPDRTMIGWAGDVAELCSTLEIERFGLIGVSGGAAYAAAVAHGLPDRVSGAALVSSGGPLDSERSRDGMARGYRVTWLLARRFPSLLRALLGLQAKQLDKDPTGVAVRMLRSFPEVDRSALAERSEGDRVRFFIEPMVEALAQGPEATVQDLQLLARPWGFDPAAVTVPVSLWHGSADTAAPLAMATDLSTRIPGAEINVIDGGGHLSVILDSIEEAIRFALTT